MNRDLVIRRTAMGGVIAAATVISYVTLHHRAVAIGISDPAAWLYPIAFDALVLGASRTWQNSELSDSTRRLAKYVTLGAIVAAVLAFVAEFAPRGIVAVLFACVVPAALAASLVLTSRAAADRRNSVVESSTTPEPTVTFTTLPLNGNGHSYQPVSVTFPPSEEVKAEQKRAWVHEQLDAGVELTGAMIDKQFPSKGRNGAKLLKSVKQERDALRRESS